MKRLVFFLIFNFVLNVSNAQKQNDSIGFVGSIEVKGNNSFSYALRFIIDEKSNIKGYSINDIAGKYETFTQVEGKYDSLKKTISFREKKIIRSKMGLSGDDLCFISCTLKLNKNKMGQMLEGNFVGYKKNSNEICGTGKIKMLNVQKAMEKIQAIMQKREAKNRPKETKVVKDTIVAPKVILDNNKETVFDLDAEEFTLSVWDSKQLDDDAVSIYYNNKLILENYVTKHEPKKLILKINKKAINELKIVAVNEGAAPPNTTSFSIATDNKNIPIQLKASKDEVRIIKIK